MKRIKLIASPGMILTNGVAFGKVVFLGSGDSADHYYEVTEAQAQKAMEAYDEQEVHAYV